MEPGIYEIEQSKYHADPCPTPSLSASIGKVLLGKSPRHAWTAHPRLNPEWEPENKAAFDLGSCAHSVLLGSQEEIVVVGAKDWRTAAAKAERDAARAAGNIPVLSQNMVEIGDMVDAAKAQLARHLDAKDAFTDGKPEMMAVWKEETAHGEIWCRCLVDWLPNDKTADLFDYKTTSASANPDNYVRQVFEIGHDLQAAFYRRGLYKLGAWAGMNFNFVVQETAAPYALSVIGLSPSVMEMADQKVEMAIDQWAWCVANDRWSGYPNRTAYVDAPVYAEQKWLDKKGREEMVGGRETAFQQLIDWQRPLVK